MTLAADESLEVAVKPVGLEIGVALLAPDGSTIASYDTLEAGSPGRRLWWVAQAAGTHLIEVQAHGQPREHGRYVLETQPLRPASSRDRQRVGVQSALLEAADLGSQGRDALPRALAVLERAAGDAAALGEPTLESMALERLGDIHYAMGHLLKTREYWEKAFAAPPGDAYSQANAFNSLAMIHSQLGDHVRATSEYERALALFRQVGAEVAQAVVLSNLASVSQHLGDPRRARDYLRQSLTLVAGRDPQAEALALHNLAAAHRALGELDAAFEVQGRALELCRRIPFRPGEAAGLRGLAWAYAARKQPADALKALDQSLEIYRSLGDRRGEGLSLDAIARVHLEDAEPDKARTIYAEALPLARESGDFGLRARVLAGLTRAALDLRRPEDARTYAEEAVSLYEASRPRMLREDLSLSYWALAASAYEGEVEALMALHERSPGAGLDRAALEASERGRGHTLLELLAEADVDVREGVAPELLEREVELRHRIGRAAQARMRLQGKPGGPETAGVEAEIDELLAEHQRLLGTIRETSDRYAALTQPAPITLPQIQELLEEGTVLVEYDLGPRRSHVWAATRDEVQSYVLPEAAAIEALAREVHEGLTARNTRLASVAPAERVSHLRRADARAAAATARLGEILLAPLRPRPTWRRLVIVADGALHSLPFAALTRPATWPAASPSASDALLVSAYEVTCAPSAAVVAALRRDSRPAPPRSTFVLADPVFDRQDPRVRTRSARKAATEGSARLSPGDGVFGQSGPLPRLAYTRELADHVLGQALPGSSRKAVDFEASRETALSPQLGEYRTVVFASHGFMDGQRPELSGIALSLVNDKGEAQDGVLRLHDVYNLRLNAELVVLAACETGLGPQIKGEGLIALSRGFLYAGARRVLASLWEVEEEATAELIQRFLAHVERDGMSHAAALRQAQLELRQKPRWSSPYFWAGFVLQGEWR
jgi:CHAT domain-containing protein/tetratricopeptide (TPR) repeat protein